MFISVLILFTCQSPSVSLLLEGIPLVEMQKIISIKQNVFFALSDIPVTDYVIDLVRIYEKGALDVGST